MACLACYAFSPFSSPLHVYTLNKISCNVLIWDFFVLFCFSVSFEMKSHYTALAVLKLTDIPQPQLPESQAHRHAPHTSLLVSF